MSVRYGGDLRIGDLRNTGQADLLVYRSADDAHDGGGMKPCFLGAFTLEGEAIWQTGAGGTQPCRPGSVAIHDIDGDGQTEVICFFLDDAHEAPPTSMANVIIQVRDGATGAVKQESVPPELTNCSGHGPNWAHQRILIANLRGMASAQDFIIKLGEKIIACTAELKVLWTYTCPWTDYGRCPAYIPAVGDIDDDGRDEVNGGYFLLDDDGSVLWERDLAPHMDSAAISPWDGGHMRAICSGHGHVLDATGRTVLRLGEEVVPHGQEVRVARFIEDDPEPQMIVRWNGHDPGVRVVDSSGAVIHSFELNPSPNDTGMEIVYWDGPEHAALLYNGGMLWDPIQGKGMPLPDLPTPEPAGRMAWYHCIPANVCGDDREELVLYNPWSAEVYIYTQADSDAGTTSRYRHGPRQFNPRLMD